MGIGLADPEVVGILNRVKAPYNIGGLTQQTALALLRQYDLFQNRRTGIILERERLIRELNEEWSGDQSRTPVRFLSGPYEPERFYQAVKGLEKEPEGGLRCTECFSLRLEEAARMAAEGGYDFFTTTLSISPLKDAERLNRIGEEMGAKYGIAYLNSDFKKKNGYRRSIELSALHHLYRQDYCGCVYSKRQRESKVL